MQVSLRVQFAWALGVLRDNALGVSPCVSSVEVTFQMKCCKASNGLPCLHSEVLLFESVFCLLNRANKSSQCLGKAVPEQSRMGIESWEVALAAKSLLQF